MQRIFRGRLVMLSVLLGLLVTAAQSVAVSDAVEDAVLSGHWHKVIERLHQDDQQANNPVARLLMAHASVATNKNNEALLLFLSVHDAAEVRTWVEWTEKLVNQAPHNPTAHYLLADAKARQGHLDEAIEGFSHALELRPDFVQAYSALGVVHSMTNDWDLALLDLLQATRLNPECADAYANLGTYWLMRETPDGAEEAFNQAIHLDSEFALAYNGRGVARFGQGKFEEAIHDFNTAYQLSPVLVVADLNAGLANAYAAQVVTVADKPQPPGMSLETIVQHSQSALQQQRQEWLQRLPTNTDHDFWTKIDRLDALPVDAARALVAKHGMETVQAAVFLKSREDYQSALALNQESQALKAKVDRYNLVMVGSALVDWTASVAYSTFDLSEKWRQQGWKAFRNTSMENLAQAGAQALVREHTLNVLLSSGPTVVTNPAASILNSVAKTSQYVAGELSYAAISRQNTIAIDTAQIALRVRGRQQKLDQVLLSPGYTSVTAPTARPTPSSVPGYFTNIDKPLTELSSMASMADKTISKAFGGAARRALVVADDPLRAGLLQQELHRYGFATRVVPSGGDVLKEAKSFGAHVTLGIRGAAAPLQAPLPAPDLSRPSPFDPPKPMRLPFPPDRGGSAGAPAARWDWGKPFALPQVKGAPGGGVRTEEVSKAFVDKGNWPVKTGFSLFYRAAPKAGQR